MLRDGQGVDAVRGARVQVELELFGLFRQPGIQLHRHANDGHHVAAALFAGADHHLLPLFALLLQPIGWQLDAAALGEERSDAGDAQLDGFLDGEVHLVATADHLTQMNGEGGFHRLGIAAVDGHFHRLFADAGDGGGILIAIAVEQLELLARLHAQYPADMVGAVFRQGDGLANLQGGRFIDTWNAHGCLSVSCLETLYILRRAGLTRQ